MADNSFAEESPEATPHASNGHKPPLGRRLNNATRSPRGSDNTTGSPSGSAETPKNEFTFGWDDLEISEVSETSEINDLGPSEASDLSTPEEPLAAPPLERSKPRQRVNRRQATQAHRRNPKPQSQPLPTEGAVNPRVLRLARQAAQSVDPVVAVGLIAASAPLVLHEDELLPSLVSALAWVAWRLHRHPARRMQLTMLPEALRRVATKVRARMEQGRSLPTRLLIQLLLKEIEEQRRPSASLPELADDPKARRRGSFVPPRRDALARLNQLLQEWEQDEPRLN